MQHSGHTSRASIAYHRGRIGVGIARVDDDWPGIPPREIELTRECEALLIAWRVVVVVVQPTFTDGDRTSVEEPFERRNIDLRVERRGIVWMDASGERDEARMRFRNPGRAVRLIDGRADADDTCRARIAGARDYRVAVAVERFVGEVGVAVEEPFHAAALVLRGYLCSIQRRTGPAM